MKLRYSYFNREIQGNNNLKTSFCIPLQVKKNVQALSKKDIVILLDKDGVAISQIEWIKILSGEDYANLPDELKIQADKKEIQLLIKLKETLVTIPQQGDQTAIFEKKLDEKLSPIIEELSNLHVRLNEITQEISILDTKISEAVSMQTDVSSNNEIVQNINESKLDIAYLFSNPVIKIQKKGIVPMENPIGFESEIDCLVNIFNSKKSKLRTCFDIAHVDTFSSVIRMNPKILHISCHGSYDEYAEFYLHFEDDYGRMQKFDLETLEELIAPKKDENSPTNIEVVFVNACHSEAIAEVFIKANVPVVICVHSSTQILDEAAKRFAKNFYSTILDGKSIKYAFNSAKGMVQAYIDKGNYFHCCCSHLHKNDCPWKIKAHKENDDPHLLHQKNCACNFKESHMHTLKCAWAKRFIEKFGLKDIPTEQNIIKVCCCYPQVAHGESNKFLLKCKSEAYQDKILFPNLSPGMLEILNKNCSLNLNFNIDLKSTMTGRNKELYNIIKVFCNENRNKNRLVTIYGDEGMGKTSFIKLTGRYMYERNFFPDGVVFIDSQGVLMNEMWLVTKILESLELETRMSEDIKKICKLISNLKILIIIKFSKRVEIVYELKETLKYILQNTNGVKFLIGSPLPLKLDAFENAFQLQPLDSTYSAKLLNVLASEYLPENLKNNIDVLKEDRLIQISQGNPSTIHKIAGLLQEHKKYDIVIERIKKENTKSETLMNELLKILLDNANTEKQVMMYELLYLLYILPNGILYVELSTFFPENCREIEEIIDYMSERMIVVKTVNKELSCIYTISSEMLTRVENFVPTQHEDIKIQAYKKSLVYYSILCRKILNLFYSQNWYYFLDTAMIEFSAAQNHGMWCKLGSLEISPLSNDNLPANFTKDPMKRFKFAINNIANLITLNNKHLKALCVDDKIFIASLEDLSICVPTLFKLEKNNKECFFYYEHFLKICSENKLVLANARLLLFSASININLRVGTQDTNTSFNAQKAEEIFQSMNFVEGVAEAVLLQGVGNCEVKKTQIEGGDGTKKAIDGSFIQETDALFDKACEILRGVNDEIGLARALCVGSEYRMRIFQEYSSKIEKDLKESVEIYQINNQPLMKIKALLSLSYYYLNAPIVLKNLNLCKEMAEQARATLDEVTKGNTKMHGVTHELKNTIKDLIEKSRIDSYNICVFLRAKPLAKKQILTFARSHSVELGSFTSMGDYDHATPSETISFSVSGKFTEKLFDRLAKHEKEMLLKFDILTEDTFRDYLCRIGRVLCVTAWNCNSSGSLYVETGDGDEQELSINEMTERFKMKKIVYDVVILCIPQSRSLAEYFINKGVSHVLCFEIEESFLTQARQLPMMSFNTIMEDCVISFTESLVTHNVKEAHEIAKNEFSNNLMKFNRQLNRFTFENEIKESSDLGAVLLLPDSDMSVHEKSIYTIWESEKDEYVSLLKEGKVDRSINHKRARLENLKRRNHAIVGRNLDIYDLVKMISVFRYVNFYGDPGTGKTCVIKETCYYLYLRTFFATGIFYFDLTEIRTIEQLKDLFARVELASALEECKKKISGGIRVGPDYTLETENKMLIVFDSMDAILEQNETNLFLFLSSLDTDGILAHFVLISQKKIENKNSEKFEYYSLRPLEESNFYSIFLHYCKRNILSKEIDYDPNERQQYEKARNLSEQISFSMRLRQCKGIPKYIVTLAEKCSVQSLNTIAYEDFLPNSAVRSLTRRNSLRGIKHPAEQKNKISFTSTRDEFMSKMKLFQGKNRELINPKEDDKRQIMNKNIGPETVSCLNPNKKIILQGNIATLGNDKLLEMKIRAFQKPKDMECSTSADVNPVRITTKKVHETINAKATKGNLGLIQIKKFEDRENWNKIIDSSSDKLIFSTNLVKIKDMVIKVPVYKYDYTLKKWGIVPNHKEIDIINQNELSFLSLNFKKFTVENLQSFQNEIGAYLPEIIFLQAIPFEIMEKVAELPLVQDQYHIAINFSNVLHDFICVLSKFNTQFYTLEEMEKKVLFTMVEIKHSNSSTFVLCSNISLAKFTEPQLKRFLLLLKQVECCITVGEISSGDNIKDEVMMSSEMKGHNNCWKIKTGDDDMKQIFKDKIFLSDKVMEIIELTSCQSINSENLWKRSGILGGFAIK